MVHVLDVINLVIGIKEIKYVKHVDKDLYMIIKDIYVYVLKDHI